MPFIHEHPTWPNLTWDKDRLSEVTAKVNLHRGQLLGRMGGLGLSLRNEAALAILTADVVKSSAIEGENLDADQVRSSIARRLGLDVAGLPPADRNVEGIVEMMLDATRRSTEPLTVERLHRWHATLFPPETNRFPQIVTGAWRTDEKGPMQVVSGHVGHEKVHFEAPAAARVPAEMDKFVEWFAASDEMDPILRAGLAHFRFVTIHPFEDGNGRIARAIADMALARSEKGAQRFYSMSSQIAADRGDYYSQLESGQRGGLDITPWMEWFADCCDRALTRAEQDLGKVLAKATIWQRINHFSVNDRQRKMINRLLDEDFKGNLTSSKYATITKVSQDTATRDIEFLVEKGIFTKDGTGPKIHYRLYLPPRDDNG